MGSVLQGTKRLPLTERTIPMKGWGFVSLCLMSSLTSVWHISEKIPEENEGRNFEEPSDVNFRVARLSLAVLEKWKYNVCAL